MAMLFARFAVPAWVVILGVGAFLAFPGIATTVLLVALCLLCIPAVIAGGIWKGTLEDGVSNGWPAAPRPPEAIEAEFVAEDAPAIDDGPRSDELTKRSTRS
jgi:hypothetical protein